MQVYRVCNEEEINAIMSGQALTNIGHEFESDGLNSHDYKSGQHYMHFFPRLTSILLVDTSAGNYICTYDIPDDILKTHYGFASYWQPDPYTGNPNVLEYAIPSNEMDYSYLERVDKIIEDIHNCEEITHQEKYREVSQTIYRKEPHKIL